LAKRSRVQLRASAPDRDRLGARFIERTLRLVDCQRGPVDLVRALSDQRIENLSGILDTAQKIAMVLTIVLIIVSTLALVISGIGIMNIMLVTVTERTREIGVRMAVGASRKEVLLQFLMEAVLISVGGGFVGILAGVALPLSVQYFVEQVRIPISWLSIVIAFGTSLMVGLIF